MHHQRELIKGDRTQIWVSSTFAKVADLIRLRPNIRDVPKVAGPQRQQRSSQLAERTSATPRRINAAQGTFSPREGSDGGPAEARNLPTGHDTDPKYALANADFPIYRRLSNRVISRGDYLHRPGAARPHSNWTRACGWSYACQPRTYAREGGRGGSESSVDFRIRTRDGASWYAAYLRLRGRHDEAISRDHAARELIRVAGVNATVGFVCRRRVDTRGERGLRGRRN